MDVYEYICVCFVHPCVWVGGCTYISDTYKHTHTHIQKSQWGIVVKVLDKESGELRFKFSPRHRSQEGDLGGSQKLP